ncbi:MAG TPA: hypothetical protein VJ755_10650, partial [Gemmatimonadales bacterium]|nr:hypothetical protein [Gemmatimonadales bacterium]
SPEIETTWVIAADSNRLTLKRPRRQPATLENAGRDIFVDATTSVLLEFERAGSGPPGALRVQSGRVRNLRFQRRTASEQPPVRASGH